MSAGMLRESSYNPWAFTETGFLRDVKFECRCLVETKLFGIRWVFSEQTIAIFRFTGTKAASDTKCGGRKTHTTSRNQDNRRRHSIRMDVHYR